MPPRKPSPSPDEVKDLVHRFYRDVLGGRSLPSAEEVLSPGLRNHGGIPPATTGILKFLEALGGLRSVAPRLSFHVDSVRLAPAGDLAIVEWTADGVPLSWKEATYLDLVAAAEFVDLTLEDALTQPMFGAHLIRTIGSHIVEIWTIKASEVETIEGEYVYEGDWDFPPDRTTLPQDLPAWVPPDRMESEVEVPVARPRWIQAQVIERDTWIPVSPKLPLKENTTYKLDVRIGAKQQNWLQATTPFPSEKLPKTGRQHNLRVTLAEIGGQGRVDEGYVRLPPAGNSSSWPFYVDTGFAPEFNWRIIVSFRNRVLQTARLTAAVGRPTQGSDQIAMVIESVVRHDMSQLARRRQFAMAFVHNHQEDGTSSGVGIVRDHVFNLVLKRIEQSARTIESMLSTVADDPASYGPTLRSEPTVELLFKLALHGVVLRDGIFLEGVPEQLAPPAPIQVLAADPNAFLPIEFVYDFPPPSSAALCRNAEAALRTGACDPRRFHKPTAGKSIDVVCPVGFWSMSRVIERHVTLGQYASDDLRGYDYSIRAEPAAGRDVLGGLTGAVYAASDKVTEDRLSDVDRSLLEVTQGRAQRARSWEQWVDAVESARPSLLVLLAHTVQDDQAGQTALEIEQSARCVAGRLNSAYVVDPSETRPPIVMLLGCETSVPYLEYQSFVVAFRNYGAALVVGTVAAVPSAHAPGVARALVTQLRSPSLPTARTFGDLMLASRRALLAEGEVMSLCLTSYGDADWRLPDAV